MHVAMHICIYVYLYIVLCISITVDMEASMLFYTHVVYRSVCLCIAKINRDIPIPDFDVHIPEFELGGLVVRVT